MKKPSVALIAGIFWLLLCIVFYHPNAIAQTGLPVYDLDMCIKNALTKHPALLQSQNMIQFNEHGIDLAKS